MAAFYIGSYDIVDPDEFRKYPPIVLALLPRYGGQVLAFRHIGGPCRRSRADDQARPQTSPWSSSRSFSQDGP